MIVISEVFVHTPKRQCTNEKSTQPKHGMRLRDILVYNSLYSEKAVTIYSFV